MAANGRLAKFLHPNSNGSRNQAQGKASTNIPPRKAKTALHSGLEEGERIDCSKVKRSSGRRGEDTENGASCSRRLTKTNKIARALAYIRASRNPPSQQDQGVVGLLLPGPVKSPRKGEPYRVGPTSGGSGTRHLDCLVLDCSQRQGVSFQLGGISQESIARARRLAEPSSPANSDRSGAASLARGIEKRIVPPVADHVLPLQAVLSIERRRRRR